jgi:hypothetical protein
VREPDHPETKESPGFGSASESARHRSRPLTTPPHPARTAHPGHPQRSPMQASIRHRRILRSHLQTLQHANPAPAERHKLRRVPAAKIKRTDHGLRPGSQQAKHQPRARLARSTHRPGPASSRWRRAEDEPVRDQTLLCRSVSPDAASERRTVRPRCALLARPPAK